MKSLNIFFFFFLFAGLSYAQTCNPSVSLTTSAASVCFGQSVTYTVSGGVTYTFSSNPGTSPSFTGSTGAVSPTSATNYMVSGTNQFGCISSTQQLIFVNPPPALSVSASPTMVCVGFSSTLTAFASPSSTAHVYYWAHGDSTSKTVVNPSVATTYTVTGTNTVTTCQNTKTITVTLFNPTFSVINDTAVCKGSSIALVVDGASSYTWWGGPVVSPTVATIYTVTITSVTNNGLKCSSTETVSIGVLPLPTVTAVSDPIYIGLGESTTLTAQGAQTYYWPSINQSGASVVVYPFTPTYNVIGTNVFGCKDTFVVTLNLSAVPGFDELQAEFSRIFPNPADELIEIYAKGPIRFTIKNDVGQMLKEIDFISAGKYTLDTRDLAPGLYFLTGQLESGIISEKIVIRR